MKTLEVLHAWAGLLEGREPSLKTAITPCQFGGNPDCSQCGCIASMGLAAVGHHKVAGNLTAGRIFMVSDRIGTGVKKFLEQPRRAS